MVSVFQFGSRFGVMRAEVSFRLSLASSLPEADDVTHQSAGAAAGRVPRSSASSSVSVALLNSPCAPPSRSSAMFQ